MLLLFRDGGGNAALDAIPKEGMDLTGTGNDAARFLAHGLATVAERFLGLQWISNSRPFAPAATKP